MVKLVEKPTRIAKLIPDAKLEVKGKAEGAPTDSGSLSGYLAVYGVIDGDGEVIRPGCFAKSIAQKVAAGKVPLMSKHFRDGGDANECIGTITKAKEDEHGLYIEEAIFSDDDDAQKIRTKIKGKHVKGLSVGFRPISFEERPPANETEMAVLARLGRTTVIEWVEGELAEGTVTVRPTNDLAGIDSAKSECPHCKGKPVSATVQSTNAGAPPVPTGTAPAATAATSRHGKAHRDRIMKMLGVS